MPSAPADDRPQPSLRDPAPPGGLRRVLSAVPGLSLLTRRTPLVTLLRLSGVIAAGMGPLRQGLNLAALAPVIEKAFAPSGLTAVAVVINSPGGSPTQSALIHDRIRALAEEKSVPVLTFAEDVAASGGYWLLAAGDEVYATPTSVVGSIGVISSGFGFQDAIAKLGVERRLYTAGVRKSLLDPFQAEKPQDVKRLRAIQDNLHATFKAHVRARRGDRLGGPDRDVGFDDESLFTGEFWLGEEALTLGLIDGLGDPQSVLRAKFGDRVRIRPILPRRGFSLGPLRLGAGLAQAGPLGAGPVDGGQVAEALVGGALTAIEERAMWGRYGI